VGSQNKKIISVRESYRKIMIKWVLDKGELLSPYNKGNQVSFNS